MKPYIFDNAAEVACMLRMLRSGPGTTQKCSALQNLRQLNGGQANSRHRVQFGRPFLA